MGRMGINPERHARTTHEEAERSGSQELRARSSLYCLSNLTMSSFVLLIIRFAALFRSADTDGFTLDDTVKLNSYSSSSFSVASSVQYSY